MFQTEHAIFCISCFERKKPNGRMGSVRFVFNLGEIWAKIYPFHCCWNVTAFWYSRGKSPFSCSIQRL